MIPDPRMIYDIRHLTRFDYAAPVAFARCNLRLQPADWPGQRVERHELRVSPAGRLAPVRADAGVGAVTRLTVERPVDHLAVESVARVAVDRPLPDPTPGDPTLAEVAAMARASRDPGPAGPAAYLYPSPFIALDPAIGDWCAADLAPGRPAPEAGIALARRIRAEFAFDAGATDVHTSPAEAFAARRGVCQDFTQIMVAGLRTAGLPAAYASGYIRTYPPPGRERLVGADATHAWVMLWCGPDRGWVGLDPTNGCWMGNDHVLVAMGRDYGEIAPVDGLVLGGASQRMAVSVDMAPVG